MTSSSRLSNVVMVTNVCSRYLLQFCGRWNEGVAIIGGGVMLLPSGALDEDQAVDINRRNVTGSTPLELASGQGNTEIVRYSIVQGRYSI